MKLAIGSRQIGGNVVEVSTETIDGPPPRADRILQPGQTVNVGDIRVLPLEVRHSARDALMFLVAGGQVFSVGAGAVPRPPMSRTGSASGGVYGIGPAA